VRSLLARLPVLVVRPAIRRFHLRDLRRAEKLFQLFSRPLDRDHLLLFRRRRLDLPVACCILRPNEFTVVLVDHVEVLMPSRDSSTVLTTEIGIGTSS